MGEIEKEFLSVSLYLEHPPIFFYSVCSLVTQWEKCYLHSRIKRSLAMKRASQGQQKGSCVRVTVFWIILFSTGGRKEGSSQSSQLDGSICVLQVHPGFP